MGTTKIGYRSEGERRGKRGQAFSFSDVLPNHARAEEAHLLGMAAETRLESHVMGPLENAKMLQMVKMHAPWTRGSWSDAREWSAAAAPSRRCRRRRR